MSAQPEQALQSGQGVALSDSQPEADDRFQASRLAAVDATELVVGASEGAFERLTRLAALLLDAPLAFVTVVDTTRSWYRSCVGLGPDAERFAAVEASFCRYVVEGDAPLILDDARADPRTRENSTIVGMGIVAWAGFPIHGLDGEVIGTFCVVDTVPRRWSARDVQVIETLADAASGEIALRAALAAEAQAHAEAEARVAEAAELARLVAELAERSEVLARTLRQSLLPPVLPDVPGLEVAARYQPARGEEVVGDFYDVFRAARSSWCVVMGDVCGKGPEAATVTALAHYTLRAAGGAQRQPGPGAGAAQHRAPAAAPGRRAVPHRGPGQRADSPGSRAGDAELGRAPASSAAARRRVRRGSLQAGDGAGPVRQATRVRHQARPRSRRQPRLLHRWCHRSPPGRRGARRRRAPPARGAPSPAAAAPPTWLPPSKPISSEYRDGLPRDDTAILVVQVPESPERRDFT